MYVDIHIKIETWSIFLASSANQYVLYTGLAPLYPNLKLIYVRLLLMGSIQHIIMYNFYVMNRQLEILALILELWAALGVARTMTKATRMGWDLIMKMKRSSLVKRRKNAPRYCTTPADCWPLEASDSVRRAIHNDWLFRTWLTSVYDLGSG